MEPILVINKIQKCFEINNKKRLSFFETLIGMKRKET